MEHHPWSLVLGVSLLAPWLGLGCGDDGGGDDPSPSGGRAVNGGSGGTGGARAGAPSGGTSRGGADGVGGAGDAGSGGSLEPSEGGASGAVSGGNGAAGGDVAPGGAGGDTSEPGGPWMGVRCEPAPGSAVRPYFEVPGAEGAELGDFFRLPFPNDVRRTESGLDLSGFPTPGVGSLGVDPVASFVDAIEQHDRGWGSDPTVFFRFTGALDPSSLEGAVRFVDVTGSATEFGEAQEHSFFYSNERTRYVCDDWLGVRLAPGAPLRAGHTYAVFVTDSAVAADGSSLSVAPELARVLGDEAPDEPELAAAHAAYAPLRAYLAEQDVDPTSVATATVFTVGELTAPMRELAQAAESEPAPSVSGDWVRCAEGVQSPCPQRDGARNCGAENAAFDEYHALLSLPSYQRGNPPFYKAADGGGVDVTQPPEWIDVCMALTVPKAAAPSEGFPIVISAHGTGGSFRSHVTAATNAAALSMGNVKFAVLGIDQVSHGTRRGDSLIPPELLFFNFQNPAAARGNPLQGALDQLSLARFAATLDGTSGEPAKIDPSRIVFLGHSQGATEGSLALPFADLWRGAVLSGNGASLLRALLTKTSPLNLRATLSTIIDDDSLDDSAYPAEYHPVLSLAQQWIDPADPLNFARHVALEPLPGRSAVHTFQTYGVGDTFSPPQTLAVYALAGGFAQVSPELEPLGLDTVAAPLSGNVGGKTLGLRQYAPPSGEDGHFVAFSVPAANADVIRFLGMAASGSVPEIGE